MRSDDRRALLSRLLETATVHVFDVDHTLTRHSTGRRFAQAGVREGVFRRRDLLTLPWFYLRYRIGNLTLADITREIQVIRGLSRERLATLADTTWRTFGAVDLIPAAQDHLRACRERGHTVVLLSTSFDLVLEPLARDLGVDAVLSSELDFDDTGRATGWLVGGPCYAEEKARRLAVYLQDRGLSPTQAAFYSDSFHDLPTFALVGAPVAVRPDSVLRRQARRRGWPVVTW